MVNNCLRILALSLTLIFVVLLAARQTLSSQTRQLEASWAQSVTSSSPAKRDMLRQWLEQQGCTLLSEGPLTRVSFQGSHDKCVAVVNRLLNEPYTWESWSGEKTSPTQMKGVILVKSL